MSHSAMSMPLNAATPTPRVPNSLATAHAWSQISSICVGSMPSNGFRTLATITSRSSPLPEQEPTPKISSSVSTLTSVVEREFLTPDRLNTCPSVGIVARNRIVLTSVIFIAF
jgi:hypothetical protein